MLNSRLRIVDEYKSEQLLGKYLPVVKSYAYSLLKFKHLDFVWDDTIVVKIISDKIVHKAKAGGVFEIHSKKEFLKKKPLILKKARLLNANKIIIQQKIYGVELIVGIKEDAKFGKLLMVGVGGRFAEQLKDVSFRVLPIKRKDFESMLDDLKNQAMLSDLDRNKLWLFVRKLIDFVLKHKEIAIMDLNPVIIESDTKKPIIVDARIYVK